MMLVTLEQAKQHLRVDFDDEDGDITLKIHAASGAVMNYLKSGADAFLDSAGDLVTDSNGDPVGVPFEVQAATLLMTGYLYKDRDQNSDGAFSMGYLPAPVTALLYPLRDPAIA
jgi:hypothetical protein